MTEQEKIRLASIYFDSDYSTSKRFQAYDELSQGIEKDIDTVEKALNYLERPDFCNAGNIGSVIYDVERRTAISVVKKALDRSKELNDIKVAAEKLKTHHQWGSSDFYRHRMEIEELTTLIDTSADTITKRLQYK